MAAVAAASIMSHGYKKNKLLPHDDDDFVLLRFAIFAFTILTTYIGIWYIRTTWTLLWCGIYYV